MDDFLYGEPIAIGGESASTRSAGAARSVNLPRLGAGSGGGLSDAR
jgi:hypothetical protein